MRSQVLSVIRLCVLVFVCTFDLTVARAADLSYQTDGTTGVVWSVGPDRKNNQRQTKYDPTNGAYSAGDILYPTTTVTSDGTPEGEMLQVAINNVNAVGYGLQRCKSDNNKVPTPTLKSPMQWTTGYFYLTTPIAYVYGSYRDTKYGYTTTTLETKRVAREIATALNAYFHDNNSFPIPPLDRAYTNTTTTKAYTLTSPIAYLNSIPKDPYKPTQVFGFQHTFSEFLLNSAGPDGDYDVWTGFASSSTPVVSYAKQYDYNSTLSSKNGDITYTNSDGFGDSVWVDPYEVVTGAEDWNLYSGPR